MRLAAYGEQVEGTPFGRYRLIELLGRGGVTDRCAGCSFTYDLSQAAMAGEGIRERVAEVAAILRNRDVDLQGRHQLR